MYDRAAEVFAACVLSHAVVSLSNDPQAAWRLALRLEREFQLTYGSAPPLHHRGFLQGPEPASDGIVPGAGSGGRPCA